MPNVNNNYGIIGAVTAKQVAVGENARIVTSDATDRHAAPALIPMREIDSFRAVIDVPPERVGGLSYPLQVPEVTVKQILAEILAEPFVRKDYGGEMDDLFTSRMVLADREVTASFLLKGPGLKGRGATGGLTLAGLLGHNGDQIERMMTQPAEVFVVQYVGTVAESVRQRLNDAIIARRNEGNQYAVGSVWDGVDTARLLTAYGYLDPDTGTLGRK